MRFSFRTLPVMLMTAFQMLSGAPGQGFSAADPVPQNASQPQPPAGCDGLPPGKHAQLERMTAGMSLSCEQQLKIEALLHDEESVSKPLLRFPSFSAAQRREVMTEIKLAARRQIRPLLMPDQQKWMDEDMAQVARSGKKSGGSKDAGSSPAVDPLEAAETLGKAVMSYAALLPDEKRTIVLQVKKAVRNDNRLQLTPEQLKKLDAEIESLSK